MRIVTVENDKEGILREDLTGITTTPEQVAGIRRQMSDICRKGKRKGVGLAANQVGLRMNLFLVTSDADKKVFPVDELCLNPTFEPAEGSTEISSREGCLSLEENAEYAVTRHSVIQASWTNAQGHARKAKLKGLAARVWQHETDHLRGLTLRETGTKLKKAEK